MKTHAFTGRRTQFLNARALIRLAGWKPAIQQTRSLRYAWYRLLQAWSVLTPVVNAVNRLKLRFVDEREYAQGGRRSGRKKFVLWPLLIAGVVVLFQYCSSQKYVNPETGRAARVAMSEGQEEALGLQSYQEVLSSSRVMTEGPEVEVVQRVMWRARGERVGRWNGM